MSTRLEQLEKMLQREPNDTFLLYGVAMEHKKTGNTAAHWRCWKRSSRSIPVTATPSSNVAKSLK